ncbi:MAG: hypothetical protein ACD_45C00645G0002 [uncultured bacterium]|nr:MAG: hypothetical protein ACD_45C00645G0002 [uncultured bacterium]
MLIKNSYPKIKSHVFLLLLLCAIFLGALTGIFLGSKAHVLKPLGDIFLNLLFTVVTPLVFFSIASAISELTYIGKIFIKMLLVFLFTSIIAAIFMLIVVMVFPLGQGMTLPLATSMPMMSINLSEHIVNMLTVSDFLKLFSRENMLALIIISILVGVATASLGEKAKSFAAFLQAGKDVSMKVVSYVMYYAPIGFFAYFAVLIGDMGSTLLESYLHVTLVYYFSALIYFVFALSFYAYLANKTWGVKIFWKNISLPAVTAFATCSSAASIPANLQATQQMGVTEKIYELVIPLGSLIHKDGSVLGGIVKIAFLFGLLHMPFASADVLMMACLISILVGTVMGAIPSGGMVGEMLILSVYAFPPQTLILMAAISLLIDPPATLLNVTSNTVCSMLVDRFNKSSRVSLRHT